MVKKVKTKNVADDSEAKVTAVPTKKKIVKPVPPTKVKAVNNGADANTNGTAKVLKKVQKLKEKVEDDGVVSQNAEHAAVPAKKSKTSETPAAESTNDSVVSTEKVQSEAEAKPETPGENGKENKLKRKKRNKKKAKKSGKKKELTPHEQHLKKLEIQRQFIIRKKKEIIINYLQVWKNSREIWKFETQKQAFIQNYILDETVIDADMFPTALEYLSGAKGTSLTRLLFAAKLIIKEIDAAPDADASAKESSKYKRAREILQSLG